MHTRSKSKLFLAVTVISVLLVACGTPTSTVSSTPVSTAAATDTPGAKLNLNTVSADELLNTIPGFGNRMVREFQEYRPYVSIEQFRREIGKYVDDAQVAEYEKYVYVPIAVNEADAATLQQIPGLEETEAASLIAARPFATNEAFLTALGVYVSADELALAESYLAAQ
jgi:DNA uptake protein ComE-like DNA-binding protein